MKRYILIFILILTIPLLGSVRKSEYFLIDAAGDPSPIDVDATVTKTNGTDFDSEEISIEHSIKITLTVKFKRAAGSASTVDIEIEVSPDYKSTWSLLRSSNGTALIRIPTNEPVVSGTTVVRSYQLEANGFSHFRIKSVENTDAANNITEFNVMISM